VTARPVTMRAAGRYATADGTRRGSPMSDRPGRPARPAGPSSSVGEVTASQVPSPAVERRLRKVQSVADARLSGLNASELLAELLERVREAVEADTAAVLLFDHSSGELVATAASGLEQEVSAGVRIPVAGGRFAAQIARARAPVILDRVDETTVRNPFLLRKKIKSVAGVPLLADGAVLGVLHAGSLSGRPFGEDDVALLQLAADRAAVAVQALASRSDREAAAALQRSLVPRTPPRIAGANIAVRYVPGTGNVGGDW
jgi:sigma-B regulation protein RsbU (phosphoserine phosphatase)